MRDFILKAIADASFFETLAICGILLFGPGWLIKKGFGELIKSDWDISPLFISIALLLSGLVSYAAAIWLFFNFGGVFLSHALNSFGPMVFGLLIAIFICVIALPIGYSGLQLRIAWEFHKRGPLIKKGRAALWFGGIGIVLVVVVAILLIILLSVKFALGFIALALIALAMGWFCCFLVPDIG